MIDWRGDEFSKTGCLNGVHVASASRTMARWDWVVQCQFPACVKTFQTGDLQVSGTSYVLAQLAWFTWKLGVVGAPLGEAEPVVCVTGGWDRKGRMGGTQTWEWFSGVYRAHDQSVEAPNHEIVPLGWQWLLLRSPKVVTGIDERNWTGTPIRYV